MSPEYLTQRKSQAFFQGSESLGGSHAENVPLRRVRRRGSRACLSAPSVDPLRPEASPPATSSAHGGLVGALLLPGLHFAACAHGCWPRCGLVRVPGCSNLIGRQPVVCARFLVPSCVWHPRFSSIAVRLLCPTNRRSHSRRENRPGAWILGNVGYKPSDLLPSALLNLKVFCPTSAPGPGRPASSWSWTWRRRRCGATVWREMAGSLGAERAGNAGERPATAYRTGYRPAPCAGAGSKRAPSSRALFPRGVCAGRGRGKRGARRRRAFYLSTSR